MKIALNIIRESIRILIIASILSSIGGLGLELVQKKILMFLPLLILFPALNNMTGSFGVIFSSRFATLLYLGKVQKKLWKYRPFRQLIMSLFTIASFGAIYIAILANLMAYFNGFPLDATFLMKTLLICFLAALILMTFIIIVSVSVGLYIFKRNHDPDNFLIPISTSIADLGSMAILAGLIFLWF